MNCNIGPAPAPPPEWGCASQAACRLGRLDIIRPGMATQSRMLKLMILFSETESALSAEQIAERLGATLSTTYRDLQKLRQYGFIEQVLDDRFVLGGRISMLDRIARTTNVLLAAAGEEMARLSTETGLTVTLTRLYGNAILGLGHVDGDSRLSIGYERGQVVPLFRGCTGKVILAALPWRNLRKIFDGSKEEIRAAGLGEDWQQFRANVRGFGANPVLWTEGEVMPDNIAVATVLLAPSGMPLGSMTIILRRAVEGVVDRGEIERTLIRSRQTIESGLAARQSAQ